LWAGPPGLAHNVLLEARKRILGAGDPMRWVAQPA
jgi:hypothetical protein